MMDTKFVFADDCSDELKAGILRDCLGDGPELLITFRIQYFWNSWTRANLRCHFVDIDELTDERFAWFSIVDSTEKYPVELSTLEQILLTREGE